MIEAVKAASQGFPHLRFVVPVHPNPAVRAAITARGTGLEGVERVTLLQPLPYDEFVLLLAAADAVLTDSGGLQEEAVALGKRVFIMRHTTERPEALLAGGVTLVGVDRDAIVQALREWSSGPSASTTTTATTADELAVSATTTTRQRPRSRLQFGDGRAGARVATAIRRLLQLMRTPTTFAAYQACRAELSPGAMAQLARPANADHTTHAFHWHSGEEALLPAHIRHHHRVECSAQPPVPTVPGLGIYELLDLPSAYNL